MAWRICSESNNLMVQLLRSKYFRNGDILHQKIEAKNCSYVWNGITKGMIVAQQHYFMKINNGRGTKIWLDRWIPGMTTPPVPVNELFRFYADVVELIIPGRQDIWMPSKDGNLSVRSTYNKLSHCAREANVNGIIIDFVIWKKLWKSGATHIIKLFIWKCIREINQTRDKPEVHNAEQETQCGCCGTGIETIEHLLLECRHARIVWRGVNINIDAVRNNCTSVSDWCTGWFTTDNSTNEHWLFTLMIGAWIIWKDKCDSIFQGVTLNPFNSVHKINYHLLSHLKSYNLAHGLMHNITSHWIPHSPGILNINVDASFDNIIRKTCTGLIIRDETGACRGIKGSFVHGALNTEEAECMEIREALAWAKEKSYNKIQIEADAKLAIQSITGTTSLIQWENRNILKEIKHLSSCFSLCNFSFIGRDDNQVAYAVAKSVRTSELDIELYDNFSANICSLLAKDSSTIDQ
ncbi:uncharacterized protein LOC113324744 [Papaver somniferum]|uniref:uncharacterized protein LOC113324744 n=1 Tax=Papaver somniferum TaxID=3469 RepID=UPI000E705029|nr:uncharacterized protein LOC113324744 [Papaver somniferum]